MIDQKQIDTIVILDISICIGQCSVSLLDQLLWQSLICFLQSVFSLYLAKYGVLIWSFFGYPSPVFFVINTGNSTIQSGFILKISGEADGSIELEKSYIQLEKILQFYIQLEKILHSTIKLTFQLEKILHETFERQIICLKTGPE